MLAKMKRKTYRNFLVIRNKLIKEKGYDTRTAADLTHRIFENHSLDAYHSIKWFYDRILTKEEYETTYGGNL